MVVEQTQKKRSLRQYYGEPPDAAELRTLPEQ